LLSAASSACIHLQNRSHLPTLLALTNLDAELGTRSHNFVPGVLQDANVQERIAGAIRQLNEAKAFLFVEPFDRGINRGATGGCILAGRSSK